MELKAQRRFMQILSRPIRRNGRGYALIIIMCFLGVCLVIFASIMYWITSSSYVTARNNQFNMSEAAAEAATEKVLSQMNYDYVAQSLSNNGAYYGSTFIPTTNINQQANWPFNDQASWPIKYAYSATNGAANQISVYLGVWTTNTVPLGSQYTNLYGLVQPCIITATATPIGQRFTVPATVNESIQFASIPLFQFAIFYNMDLEIAAAQTLNIVGPVWSNGGIWSGSTTVTFQNTVSAVGIATNTANDPFTSPPYAGSGKSTYLLAGQPTSGNDRITMPIGTNNDPAAVEAIINLPPNNYAIGSAAAFTTNGQIYLANAADLYLTNFSTGTNWGSLRPNCTNTVYFQSNACMILYYQDGANSSSYQTRIPYDFYLLKTNFGTDKSTYWTNYVVTNGTYWPKTNSLFNCISNVQYAGYSFLTNVLFYDWREGWNNGSGPPKAVQAVQIDIQKYNIWLTNSAATNNGISYNTQCKLSTHKSHPIDSIYVYNSVPLTSTTLPAVRVANGGMLPSQTLGKGFTVATAMPLYVWGNYNSANNLGSSLGQNSTTYTWPAGLMADSITILSGGWNDGTTSKKPVASDTTVNAAMIAGIVRSTNSMYSGGVENFLRTLESWGSSGDLWYNGSIVVMFPSQYATNHWQQTGNYYDAPTRHWAFDTNFTQQAGLPPVTPQAKGVIRANWNAY
jgi:Tfp pilus assembly protein PilX